MGFCANANLSHSRWFTLFQSRWLVGGRGWAIFDFIDIWVHKGDYVDCSPHPWRQLKTKGSKRQLPLIGSSIWAAKQIIDANATYAFPRYVKKEEVNANSASAAINKWLKPRVPEGCVIHSFRHSLRDRLRAVECPSDIVDAIGGWTTSGIGQKYGTGYSLTIKNKWMKRIEVLGSSFGDQ